MTITRFINGNEIQIELTEEERRAVYYDLQEEFDLQDIKAYFDIVEIDDFCGENNITITELQKLYPEMAEEMRRNIDKYDMSFEYARDEAIMKVMRRSTIM